MKMLNINHLEALDYNGNEALNTICSNLSFAGRDLKKVIITSCTAGNGKSYLAMQIAYNLARRGKAVLLIDCDLRRSVMVSRYDIRTPDNSELKGIAHYLAGYADLNDVVYETNMQNLYFLPVGRDVANPVPLIDSPAFASMLEQLSEGFDLLLLDAPPVGLVIDAAEIAAHCDGLVFVAEYNKTRRREMLEAKRQIEASGCPILGCVLNQVDFSGFAAKRYYNRSYYSHYNSEYYYRRDESGNKVKVKRKSDGSSSHHGTAEK